MTPRNGWRTTPVTARMNDTHLRITLEPHARPRPRFSTRRQCNPVHRVPGHRPTTWHAAPSPSRTRPSDNACHSGAFANPGKRLPNPLLRVREHRETPKHPAASRPRTPQGDMTSWSLEINNTPQRQDRPFQRDPQHQQTAHPAVPSRARSEHSDSACHSLQIETPFPLPGSWVWTFTSCSLFMPVTRAQIPKDVPRR